MYIFIKTLSPPLHTDNWVPVLQSSEKCLNIFTGHLKRPNGLTKKNIIQVTNVKYFFK